MFDELCLKMETHKWGSGTDQIPKKSANTGWGMVIALGAYSKSQTGEALEDEQEMTKGVKRREGGRRERGR